MTAGLAFVIEDRHGLFYAGRVDKHSSCPMHRNPDDETIRRILTEIKTIAVVGVSDKPDRPAHGVMAFLQDRGYRTIPVNPRLAGNELLGEPVYATLTDIPERIDMVDLFMNAKRVEPIVSQALDTDAEVVYVDVSELRAAP